MEIRAVSKLEVLELKHSKIKHPPKTALNLRLDKDTASNVILRGEVTPASGTRTVAAFSSGESPTLLGWIDPQSGHCFHVWRPNPGQAIAALLLATFCFYLFPEWETLPLWLAVLGSIATIAPGIWLLIAPGFKQRGVEKALLKRFDEVREKKGKAKKAG